MAQRNTSVKAEVEAAIDALKVYRGELKGLESKYTARRALAVDDTFLVKFYDSILVIIARDLYRNGATIENLSTVLHPDTSGY